jgi:hypothetical protein
MNHLGESYHQMTTSHAPLRTARAAVYPYPNDTVLGI